MARLEPTPAAIAEAEERRTLQLAVAGRAIAEAERDRAIDMVDRLAKQWRAVGGFMTMADQEALREATALVAELKKT